MNDRQPVLRIPGWVKRKGQGVDGDREPFTPYHLVVIANTRTFGGGMRVAPTADAADG
jgi:hypothetical protein